VLTASSFGAGLATLGVACVMHAGQIFKHFNPQVDETFEKVISAWQKQG